MIFRGRQIQAEADPDWDLSRKDPNEFVRRMQIKNLLIIVKRQVIENALHSNVTAPSPKAISKVVSG